MTLKVIGAGLAGTEAAHCLANLGYDVELREMKPEKMSPAHRSDGFAELVCSNSFKSQNAATAAGLLKEEMRALGSLTLEVAQGCKVPAGSALAVDRLKFSEGVTGRILSNPRIRVVRGEVFSADEAESAIIATGPLTGGALADWLSKAAGGLLSFYDAAAPIVASSGIDMDAVFKADRYGAPDAGDYLNCYFDKAGYEAFRHELVNAKTAELKDFDVRVYEGCMPIERLAARGADAARFGPMKPVGLTDPRTGRRPWAAVQLRKEDEAGSLYNIVGFQTNLRFSEQRRVFRMIPGLENAEFVRCGVMHRNTFLDSPAALFTTLNLKRSPNIFVAGQLTGFEGYMESAASGILAARFLHERLSGRAPAVPSENTMCGALLRYISAPNRDFQPMGANMGLLPPLEETIKDKKARYAALSARALADMKKLVDKESL